MLRYNLVRDAPVAGAVWYQVVASFVRDLDRKAVPTTQPVPVVTSSSRTYVILVVIRKIKTKMGETHCPELWSVWRSYAARGSGW